MSTRRSLLTARLLWIFPGILLFLTINQVKVALDVRQTLEQGRPATAEVVEVYKTNRVDVTYSHVKLRVALAPGDTLERLFPLPLTLMQPLEGKDSLDVRIIPGEAQDIVITEIARPQWRMAAINAAMSFVGLVLLTVGVFAWNRYLKRRGDPAEARREPV